MLKVLKYLGTLILALLLLLAISPYFISLNSYKSEITTKVDSLTGRKLTLKGDITFSVLPRPYLKLSNIEVASLPENKKDALAKVKELKVILSILPLFRGQIQVDEIVLKEPKIFLEMMSSSPERGQGNREIMLDHDLKTSKKKEKTLEETPSPFQLRIEKIKIKDGKFSYLDGHNDYEAEGINLSVRLENLEGPYEFDLELETLSQNISAKGKIGALTYGEPMPVNFVLKAFGNKAKVIGHVDLVKKSLNSDLILEGKLSSLKSLLPSLNLPKTLKEKYVLSSKLTVSSTSFRLDDITFSLPPFQANGALDMELAPMSGALKLHLMPGDVRITLKPSSRYSGAFSGSFAIKARKSRNLLQALDVPLKDLPTFVQDAFSLKTDFSYEDKNISLKNIDLDVGKARLNGDFSVKNWGDKGSYRYELQTADIPALARLFDVSLPKNLGPMKLKGTALGALSSLRLTSNIHAAGATISVDGKLEMKDKSIKPHMKISAKGKNLSRTLMHLDVTTPPKRLTSFGITAHLAGDVPQRLKVQLEKFHVRMHNETLTFAGNMDLFLARTKPKISAKLTLSKLDLDRLIANFERENQNLIQVSRTPLKVKKPKKLRWSHKKIDLEVLKSFDGDISLSAPQLKKGSLVFDDLKTTLRVANGILDVSDLTGNLYGGKLTLKARVSSQKGQPITLTAHLKNAQLKNISPSDASIKIIKGQFSLDADITTSGQSMYQYVSNLAGSMNFKGSSGRISGFDLDRVVNDLESSRNIGSALHLLNTAFSGGTTNFKSINAVTIISKGIVRIKKFDLDAIKAKVTAKGSFSLPAYKMTLSAHVVLDAKDIPPFDVDFYGPLDNPGHTIKASALKQYFVQNVIGGIVDNINNGDGGTTNILNSVFGVQQQKKETENQPKQQQKTEIKPQPPLEKAVEKAVGDILNNLF